MHRQYLFRATALTGAQAYPLLQKTAQYIPFTGRDLAVAGVGKLQQSDAIILA